MLTEQDHSFMRILFFTENFPPETNAAATRVYERAVYWVRWGHEVTVITTAPNFPQGNIFEGYSNRLYQTEIDDGIRVVRVWSFVAKNEGVVWRIVDFFSFMVASFIAGLFEKRPDIVVCTSPQLFCAVGAWALAAVRRLPYVFELADLWPASVTAVGAMRPGLLLRNAERLELFLYRRSDCIVALTKAFREDLTARGIPEGKIAMVLNGVDLSRHPPMSRDNSLAAELGLAGKFVVGYIGTHGMAHALENVLEVADRLRHHDDLRFLFVGGGATKGKLVRETARRGLLSVIFVAPVPKAKVPAYWSLCDVALVHLKDDKVFESVIPSKIFEAMGVGLPVLLAAPAGEASAIVGAEGVGLCVPAEEPGALAAAVLDLRDHPDRRAAFTRASHAAAPRYSRERQASEMMRALEAVLDGDGWRVKEVLNQ